jgi:hypothetical protein
LRAGVWEVGERSVTGLPGRREKEDMAGLDLAGCPSHACSAIRLIGDAISAIIG